MFGNLFTTIVNRVRSRRRVIRKMCSVTSESAAALRQSHNLRIMSHRYHSSLSFTNPPKATTAENIVWVDLEMTGLDPDKDHVLEVACLVTDSQLNILAEGPDLCIQQPQEVLDNMNDWSTKQHKESGLTHKCQSSEVSLRDAEKQLLDFVREWTPFKKCPLGGNTIYMDRLFLMKHMPDFEQHMHYRIIDVSSVKELCRRWYPEGFCIAPLKNGGSSHRAMDDIKASVEMLKYYKNKLFRSTFEIEKQIPRGANRNV